MVGRRSGTTGSGDRTLAAPQCLRERFGDPEKTFLRRRKELQPAGFAS